MNNLRTHALERLATHSASILHQLFGNEFIERSQAGMLTTSETRTANYKLAEYLYSAEVAKHVYSGNLEWLETRYKELLKRNIENKAELPWDKLGLIVVRPELYHAREAVYEFLHERQFRIIDQRAIMLHFEQYWLLYHHGLIDPDSREDFPTRTLSYINQDCWLILFDDPELRYSTPLSDGFVAEFKGARGKLQPGTLRGDLTAVEMLALGANMPLNNETALAFDPLQSYRHIISGAIPSDKAHEDAELPFLFYAGVGVHMPEAHEIERDVKVLYSNDEILRILNEYPNQRSYSQVH